MCEWLETCPNTWLDKNDAPCNSETWFLTVAEIEDKTWEGVRQAMEKEESTLWLSRAIATHML